MTEQSEDTVSTGIAHWVPRWAEVQPDATLIIFEGVVHTWGQFDNRVKALAAQLHTQGVQHGDRVACLMDNRVEYLELFWAALRLGAIFVPLNVRLTVTELNRAIAEVEPKILATEKTFAGKIADIIAAAANRNQPLTVWTADESDATDAAPFAHLYVTDHPLPPINASAKDPAAILFTSGTTGTPKGAVLTHNNIHAQAINWNTSFACTRNDRQIVFLPLCFTGGLISACMNTFLAGGSMILIGAFDPASILRQIEEHRATFFTAVPTMVQRMFEHPDAADTDLTSLRLVESGGASVPVPLIDHARTLGLELIQGYGLTEATGGVNLHLRERENLRKAGSCGKPGLYNDAKVVAPNGLICPPGTVGELMIFGPLVFDGYWNNPQATAETLEEGWLHTGDLAYRDEEGFFYLSGRTKEVIITGGLNVYPAEVEAVLRSIPAIADTAVVGHPDIKWGEAVTAYVILRERQTTTPEEITSYCRELLADYKIPKSIHFRTEFPRTTSGKVLKRALNNHNQFDGDER